MTSLWHCISVGLHLLKGLVIFYYFKMMYKCKLLLRLPPICMALIPYTSNVRYSAHNLGSESRLEVSPNVTGDNFSSDVHFIFVSSFCISNIVWILSLSETTPITPIISPLEPAPGRLETIGVFKGIHSLPFYACMLNSILALSFNFQQ